MHGFSASGELQVKGGEWGEERAARELNPANQKKIGEPRHTTAGIRWWSPTQLLTSRRAA